MEQLDNKVKAKFKEAAKLLTGHKRRQFEASIAIEFFDSSPYKTERHLGWDRHTVILGLHERRSGIRCIDDFQRRGNKRTEAKLPDLEEHIRSLVAPYSQAEPRFRTSLEYTRITAKSVREQLIEKYDYTDEQLPTERSISNILNRLGYCLKAIQKTKPEKKFQKLI